MKSANMMTTLELLNPANASLGVTMPKAKSDAIQQSATMSLRILENTKATMVAKKMMMVSTAGVLFIKSCRLFMVEVEKGE